MSVETTLPLTTDQSQAVNLLATVWPKKGQSLRRECNFDLIGGLLRNRMPADQVEALVRALAEKTGDDEVENRVQIIAMTQRKIQDKQTVRGWPSLSNRLGSKGPQIVRAVRFRLDLTTNVKALAERKRLPVEFLESLGIHNLPDFQGNPSDENGVGIPYHDFAGKTVAIKKRYKSTAHSSQWPKGLPLRIYGEERLRDRPAGYALVEGESDCWTLWLHGIDALGIPGAETVAKTLEDRHLQGVERLLVVQETDQSGESFVLNVRTRLGQLGWKGCLGIVRCDGLKDVSALYMDDPERFRERWVACTSKAEPAEVTGQSSVSGASIVTKKPVRLLPPYQPFPIRTLPAPVNTFVEQGAQALGCDASFLALPAISILASLIGNTRVIRLKGDWSEPSIIWSCVVGDSGTLKSPAIRLVMRGVWKQQKQALVEYKERLAEHEEKLNEFKEAKQKQRKDTTIKVPDDPGPLPCEPRLVASDTTIERLCELLDQNPRGILLFRDELSGWLGSFTRYKSGAGGNDVPQWLEMFHGSHVIIDRKTSEKKTIFVERAAVSVTGTIQPGILTRALTAEYREAGLAARILLTMPPKRAKNWTEIEVDPLVRDAWETILAKLYALDFDTNQAGEKEPFAVRLTPDAKRLWVEFYDQWAEVQAGTDGDLAALFSKIEGYAPRFALIHHVVSNVATNGDSCDPIEPVSMQAGIDLAKWFASETSRIYGMFDEDEENRVIRLLVEFIRSRGGVITCRNLYRARKSKYGGQDEAEEALQTLVDKGLARWEDIKSGTQGGRPTRRCVLLPSVGAKTDKTSPEDGDGDGPCDPESGAKTCFGTSAKTCETPENPAAGGGFGSFGTDTEGERHSEYDPARNGTTKKVLAPMIKPVLAPGSEEKGTAPAPWVLIQSPADLLQVIAAVDGSAVVGLDIETTGLDPRSDRVRLLSLATTTIETTTLVYLIDCFAVPDESLAPLWDTLVEERHRTVCHNGKFDLAFLSQMGFTPSRSVTDTMLLSQLLDGTRRPKGYHGLAECVQRYLGQELPKEEQTSDWSRPELTQEQLAYAARDAEVLLPLREAMRRHLQDADLNTVADIECRALPAIVWLANAGVALDQERWTALAATAERERDRLKDQLDQAAPQRKDTLIDPGWNWNSPDQVKEALGLLGIKTVSTDDDALAAIDHPLAQTLREYRAAEKKAGMYGSDWLKHLGPDGRVRADWQQIGADSGRMSCKRPGLQTLPRERGYRSCFIAPPGRVLIKADYSQIELRIAAKVSGDKALLEAYQQGEDLHIRTAKMVLKIEDVTKSHRQIAKSLNFGLLYGMGAKSFRAYARSNYGVELTLEQAEAYRKAFFKTYPGLAAWHRRIGQTKNSPVDTRTLAGRRRARITSFTEKLNTPVQGTGADGLKQALGLLWERRDQCPGAFPVLVVHDEIVIEADSGQADAAAAWLKKAMIDAMAPLIEPVPVEVETMIGTTWGGD